MENAPAPVPAAISYATVDAFTHEAFKGNPAAVCILPPGVSAAWMQLVAAEFNISQTAFLVENQSDRREYDYELRWFTPTVEVSLCGHATLASAFYLFAAAGNENDVIKFRTKSGILAAKKRTQWYNGDKVRNTKGFIVELDFPMLRVTRCNNEDLSPLPETLGSRSVLSVSKTEYGDLVVELSSHQEVENLEPSFQEILACDIRGLIVTAKSPHPEHDFYSRFFCPSLGVNEDPVCGSAHCALAPFWARKLGKDRLFAYQASKRGGKLGLELDWETSRVRLSGEAAIVMTGVLLTSGLKP